MCEYPEIPSILAEPPPAPRAGLNFNPIDGGTRMRWHWNLRPNGVLRFMGPLVASMGRRQERRIWTELKRLLESRAVP